MKLSRIVEDLYEGTLDPLAWNRAMLAMADVVRSSGVMLFAFNPSTGAVLRSENHRVDPQLVAEYNGHWISEDIRLGYALKVPVWQPETEVTMGVPLKKTRCQDYLLSIDMPYFMPAWLRKTNRKAVALTFEGSLKRGPFGPGDTEIFRRFLPHLTRTLEIRDRIEAAEIRATSLANVLETTTFGVMILDADHRIIEANAAASALLHEDSGLYLDKNEVLASRHDRLGNWLQIDETTCSGADVLLHIPREGKLPLSVLAVPVSRSRMLWLSGDPAWILLVFDGERRLTLNQQVIAKDLGLSAREAMVASFLAAGLDVSQAARRMGVTVNTVRTQLKAAFQKTGCHSQTDLVRRVLLGPALKPVLPPKATQ